MEELSIKVIQDNLLNMNLKEYDLLYNVRMPLNDCKNCGGNAVASWDGEDAVLCNCLVSTDNSREQMMFGVLWSLHNLKRKEVYNE